MRIDLLLVLGFDDEDDLNRNQVELVLAGGGKNELRLGVDGQLGSILGRDELKIL